MAVEGNKRPRPATADDFPEEGKVFTIDYPEGTSLKANDFVIAHMFSCRVAGGHIVHDRNSLDGCCFIDLELSRIFFACRRGWKPKARVRMKK